MVITSFGILVYSVFTIVAGCLNDNSFEPTELVVANGLADFVQVITLYNTKLSQIIMFLLYPYLDTTHMIILLVFF